MSVNINVGVTYNGRNIRKSFTDLNRLRREADSTSKRMQAMGAQMQLVGRSMSNVGRTLTRSVTAPLAAVGFVAVKSATEFESSFAKIRGLVGVSADQIGELEEAASRLGPQFGRTSNEAAEALFFITSAGLRGQEAIDALESSLKAAAVGLGDTATIADLVTSTVNAYGSATMSAAEATDILTNAVRLGKLEPQELAGSIGQVLPLASAMGVTFEDVGAAFAAMSRTGTNASQAATQLRQIFSSLLSPTAEANAELAKYGLSASGLRKQLRERGLLSVLETLTGTLGTNDEAITRVFGNMRALSGVLDLMGGNVESTRQTFDGMSNSTAVLDDAFGVTAETAGFQFQQALAELRETLRSLGETLLPFVQRIVESVQGLVDRFNDLSPAQQDIITKMAALAALAGPVMVFIGSLLSGIGLLIIAMGKLTIATALATGGLTILAGLIGLAIWKSASGDTDARASALEEEARAADLAAAGYHALAEGALASARALRAAAAQEDQDEARAAASASAQQFGEQLRAQADAAAAVEEAMAGLAGATDEAGSSVGASGPKVVALTRSMRDLFRELNETNVGAGDAGASIAQFSREVLAAGNITDDTVRGAERLAQVIRADLDAALADGNRRLQEATQRFDAYRDTIARGISQGNGLADAVSAQSSALDELTRAEEEYERAQESGDPARIKDATDALKKARSGQKTFLEFLQVGVTTAEGFAGQIDALRKAGASLEVVQQIAELGANTGGRIASELLAGGAAAIEQANRMVEAVEKASQRAGIAAAEQFFGAGVNAARAMVRGIEATIPELQSVLDRIAEAIERAMGTKPNVDISGKQGPFIPQSSGVTGGGGTGGPTPTPFVPDPSAPLPTLPGGLDWGSGGLPFIPGMANGGFVDSPTLALIGEAGPEMVVPLDRMGGMGATINITVTSADPQAVVEALRRYTRQNGALSQVVTV